MRRVPAQQLPPHAVAEQRRRGLRQVPRGCLHQRDPGRRGQREFGVWQEWRRGVEVGGVANESSKDWVPLETSSSCNA